MIARRGAVAMMGADKITMERAWNARFLGIEAGLCEAGALSCDARTQGMCRKTRAMPVLRGHP